MEWEAGLNKLVFPIKTDIYRLKYDVFLYVYFLCTFAKLLMYI